MPMICTFYSSKTGFENILSILKAKLPKAKLTVSEQEGFNIVHVATGGGLFSSAKNVLKISYRQRKDPSTRLEAAANCALSSNLNGLYRFVSALPMPNESLKIRDLLRMRIRKFNAEFSIMQEKGETKELKSLIQTIAKSFDAIMFAQPNTLISKSMAQHFLNDDFELVLDTIGYSEVDNLGPEVEKEYQDRERHYEEILGKLSPDQRERKLANEEVVRQMNVKVNRFLPAKESNENTNIRSPKEIANRVAVMSVINGFCSNFMTPDQVIAILKEKQLWDQVTPKEIDLLTNPTDEKKNHETWKCEGIWTLLWALGIIDDLGSSAKLCDLGDVPQERYPLHDPSGFVESISSSRTKDEILDAADLYYRLDWACVNVRVNGHQMTAINPGLVYERHYALNWLINYMGQDWDDVSTDT